MGDIYDGNELEYDLNRSGLVDRYLKLRAKLIKKYPELIEFIELRDRVQMR
jgi:hypothetical protein